MPSIAQKLNMLHIVKGFGILLIVFLLGSAVVVWQSPPPPPPLPDTHAIPMTPEELALFLVWATWTNHLMRLFTMVGSVTILVLSGCVIAQIASRGVLLGGIIMLLVLVTSFYLVNTYIQDEAARMIREMPERG